MAGWEHVCIKKKSIVIYVGASNGFEFLVQFLSLKYPFMNSWDS